MSTNTIEGIWLSVNMVEASVYANLFVSFSLRILCKVESLVIPSVMPFGYVSALYSPHQSAMMTRFSMRGRAKVERISKYIGKMEARAHDRVWPREDWTLSRVLLWCAFRRGKYSKKKMSVWEEAFYRVWRVPSHEAIRKWQEQRDRLMAELTPEVKASSPRKPVRSVKPEEVLPKTKQMGVGR